MPLKAATWRIHWHTGMSFEDGMDINHKTGNLDLQNLSDKGSSLTLTLYWHATRILTLVKGSRLQVYKSSLVKGSRMVKGCQKRVWPMIVVMDRLLQRVKVTFWIRLSGNWMIKKSWPWSWVSIQSDLPLSEIPRKTIFWCLDWFIAFA